MKRIYILLLILLVVIPVKSNSVNDVKSYLINSLGIRESDYNDYIEGIALYDFQIKGNNTLLVDSLLANRIIPLIGYINGSKASVIQGLMIYFNSVSQQPITLIIDSPGGQVYPGLGIYDTMEYISCSVYTKCIGKAASMAAVLLSSGEEGHRSATPFSKIMIHRPYVESNPNTEIIDNEFNQLENELFQILSTKTGKDLESIIKDSLYDHWFNPDEAKQYGIIDEIAD